MIKNYIFDALRNIFKSYEYTVIYESFIGVEHGSYNIKSSTNYCFCLETSVLIQKNIRSTPLFVQSKTEHQLPIWSRDVPGIPVSG